MESSHEFDIDGFKRVSGGLNKIDTRMNTIINNIRPVRFILCLKIRIKSRFNTFQNGFPTLKTVNKQFLQRDIPILVVDEISKSRGINNIKSQSNTVFFNIGTDSTDIDRLWNLDRSRPTCITRSIQAGIEQSIHQC